MPLLREKVENSQGDNIDTVAVTSTIDLGTTGGPVQVNCLPLGPGSVSATSVNMTALQVEKAN
jgi:hypothetical protein